MKQHIIVREYATLKSVKNPKVQDLTNLDEAEISQQDFDYLYELMHQKTSEAESQKKIFQLSSRTTLRVQNFVGVIETPTGTVLELLPKIAHLEDLNKLKEKLLDMILIAQNIKYRKVDQASLKSFKGPLNEYVARGFLLELAYLLRQGIRQDYINIDDEQLFLRGKLNLNKHVRHSVAKSHIFPIYHDILGLNNAENRLLKTAVEFILNRTQDSYNKKNALIFSHLMHDIPLSKQLEIDFSKWRSGRLVSHYQNIKSWCRLILQQKSPLAISGLDKGYSLLFPMEKIFEEYVGYKLKMWLHSSYTLHTQYNKNYLLEKNNNKYFRLQPDFLIKENGQNVLVLDAKWKRLYQDKKQFGLSESDVYQMYAYNHIYLKNTKNVILIYPKQENFTKAIEKLKFLPSDKDGPQLWIIPYDLFSDEICISLEGKVNFLSLFFRI
ncbi:McrC family protein [Acinetobacter sp. 256-1]|uniref:McrC family protein n=1 Tax=Acinetobacter sp. 256-1 TaxID=2746721 RepID=UPI002576B0C6|nr:McrC family protein [Acinetobacter sp. 256-1]MDM1757677.1 McrC family protein [Acinetobacter sp. 256-1]